MYSYAFNLANGVPVIPYYGNKKDNQLKYLTFYLKKMIDKDIRELNKKTFKYQLYDKKLKPEKIL